MTKLSIFLWCADAAQSIGTACAILTIICIFGICCAPFMADDFDIDFKKVWMFLIPFCLVASLIACVVPEKKTIYMIAGVELANSVMESEDFGKVKNYLGNSGVEMLDDIKAIIHAEAEAAIEKTKKTDK